MILHDPFKISARLLPALQIGEAWLSLEDIHACATREGRDCAEFVLDLPDGREYHDRTVQSGVQGFSSVASAFEGFLSFLSHAVETRENPEALFPPHILEWARDNRSAIESAHLDITDENGTARADLIEDN